MSPAYFGGQLNLSFPPPPPPPGGPSGWFVGSTGFIAGTSWTDQITGNVLTAMGGHNGNLTSGTINGHTSAGWTSWANASYYGKSGVNMSTYLSTTGWTIAAIVGPGTMGYSTHLSSVTNMPMFVGDPSGNWSVGAGNDAPYFYCGAVGDETNGSFYVGGDISPSGSNTANHYIIAQAYSNGSGYTISISIDGATPLTRVQSAGTMTGMTDMFQIGAGQSSASDCQYQGLVEELITYNSAISTSALQTYLASRI